MREACSERPSSRPSKIVEAGYRLLEPHEPNAGGLPPVFTSKRQAALHARRRGFAVLPLIGTSPAIPDWQSVATTDEVVIRQWWAEAPDYNIGGVIEDVIILSFGRRGIDQCNNLATIYGFPKTAVALSPRGELLALFRLPPGVRIKKGAKLEGAPDIDVISGGCLPLPGSTTKKGECCWANRRPMALAPQWLIDRLAEPVATVQPTQTDGENGMGAGAEAVEMYRKRHLPAPSIAADQLEETDTSTRDDDHDEKDPSEIVQTASKQEAESEQPHSDAYSKAQIWIFMSNDVPEATAATRGDTMVQVATHLRNEFGVSKEETADLLETCWGPIACEREPSTAEINDAVQQAFSADANGRQNSNPYSPPTALEPPIADRAVHAKLEHALDAVRRGFSVFPLLPNTKRPAVDNWPHRATTDETQIRRWWSENAEYNLAGTMDGKLGLDIDPRNGGLESLKTLCAVEEFPKTLRSRTQGGGTHMIYALPNGVRLGKSKGRFGAGIDVQASASAYLVLPGSTIDGRPYEWANDEPVREAPAWVVDRAKTRSPEKSTAAGKRLVEEDDDAVKLARRFIENAPEAHEGQNGDDTTFLVAARLFDAGVSKATALDLMLEWNETKAFPPWELSDLERIVDSAERNRQHPIGVKHPGNNSGFEAVDIPEREHSSAMNVQKHEMLPSGNLGISDDKKAKPRLYYLTFAEATKLAFSAGAEPLIEDVIDVETLSIVYGESGVGKSFQEMDKDFCIAADLPWAGKKVKQGAVVWIAAEGGRGVYKRLAALKRHYQRDDVPFFIVPCPVDLLRPNADTKPLIELIQEIERDKGVKVIKATVDTLSRALAGGNENGPEDMGALIKNCDKLRFACRLHLTLIHHTGLADKSRARGSSLLRAAADTEIEITRGRIRVTKQRDMEQTGEWGFRLHSLDLGKDEKGRPVSSPWVEILPKGAAPEPQGLEPELQMLADEIETKLDENATFATKTAIECAVTAAFFDRKMDASIESVTDAERARVKRALKTMYEKGWIAKLRKGRWKWRGWTDGRDG